MTEQDLFGRWIRKRCRADVPEHFAEQVMQAVGQSRRPPAAGWLAALALAAGVLLVAVLQTAAVGALFVAMGGIAR